MTDKSQAVVHAERLLDKVRQGKVLAALSTLRDLQFILGQKPDVILDISTQTLTLLQTEVDDLCTRRAQYLIALTE